MSKTCVFIGHRTVPQALREDVRAELRRMISRDDVREFFCGGMGEFDRLCACAVREIKGEYPDIRLMLVVPSMSVSVMKMGAREKYYDEIIVPQESDQAHYKRAITLRNRWMVDNSDIALVYLRREYGGAYDAARYAAKKRKPMRFIGENPEITHGLMMLTERK